MRHSKAEQGGPSDFERQLTDRGSADAAEAGTWLAERDVVPDHALVSAAVRTQQTWEALADGAGWDLEPDLDRGLYGAGPESTLDLVRATPDHVQTLIVDRPQPDDGLARPAARRRRGRRSARSMGLQVKG